MQADASNAPDETLLSRFQALLGIRSDVVGSVRTLAGPVFRQLLKAEPVLRRAIPLLIMAFLALAALVRFAALNSESQSLRADTEREMAIAALLMRAESWAATIDGSSIDNASALLISSLPPQLIEHGRFAVVSDAQGIVTATIPGHERLIGRNLNAMIPDFQMLRLFGTQAGVKQSSFDDEPAYVASAILQGDQGTVTFIQTEAELFAGWRNSVSVNVTLFAATSVVMLVILYAYFRQASRAEDADALYLETHQRVDTALSSGHCGLWDWDIGRGRMYWSRSMYEMVGLAPRDGVLAFGDIAPLLHHEDGSLFEVARKVAAGRITHLDRVFRMRRADGEYVWMRARAEVTRSGDNEVHLIGIAVDITEQQEMARRTDEANEQLNSAIENISETFVLCDAEDRLVLCNSKYRETFALAEDDVKRGTPLAAVMAKARKPIQTQAVTSPTFEAGERASEARLPDGRWLLLSERRSSDGGFVSIGTDITQLKLHQAQLSESRQRLMMTVDDVEVARRDAENNAQKLVKLNASYIEEKDRAESASRAKTTFLANMSHELRTPLNAILGFSEIMRQGTFGPIGCPKYGEYAEDIHQSGHFLLRLIDDILDMAKIEAGRLVLSPEPLDLADIVEETRRIIEVQALQRSIRFTADIVGSLPVELDRRATKQIVLNLLSNAIKFTEEGGSVGFRIRRTGDSALITVADQGIGIPAKALAGLGRPFEQIESELTRTHKGTGLGLAIARSLVELQGGRMRIFSKVDVGTIVSIRLPLSADVSTTASSPFTNAASVTSPKRASPLPGAATA